MFYISVRCFFGVTLKKDDDCIDIIEYSCRRQSHARICRIHVICEASRLLVVIRHKLNVTTYKLWVHFVTSGTRTAPEQNSDPVFVECRNHPYRIYAILHVELETLLVKAKEHILFSKNWQCGWSQIRKLHFLRHRWQLMANVWQFLYRQMYASNKKMNLSLVLFLQQNEVFCGAILRRTSAWLSRTELLTFWRSCWCSRERVMSAKMTVALQCRDCQQIWTQWGHHSRRTGKCA